MKDTKRLLITATLVLSMLIVSACMFSEKRDIKVNSFEGDVEIYRETKEEPIKAENNMELFHKDSIVVADSSEIEVEIDGDKLVSASENSEFILAATGSKEKGRIEIVLIDGTANVNLEDLPTQDSTFEVTTQNAIITVNSKEFEVSYNKALNSTIIYAADGTLTVSYKNGEETLEVKEGNILQILNDEVKTNEDIVDPDTVIDINTEE